MDKLAARALVQDTLQNSFNKDRFYRFSRELLNRFDDAPFVYRGNYIPDAYEPYVQTLERIGNYRDSDGKKIDLLIVSLKTQSSLEHARTMQRNFIAWYLNGSAGGDLKDAALVAFVAPDTEDWRFSLVKMEYAIVETPGGRVKAQGQFTPARRYSFLVGKNEATHTAQSRLVPLLEEEVHNPTLQAIEGAFNIETVTKEFFEKYRDLYLRVKETLDGVIKKDHAIRDDFKSKGVNTVDFAKKLLGQIVFLYFLQKKGWFGVKRKQEWGSGSRHFLRELFEKEHGPYVNCFNDVFEPLFYEALRLERPGDYYSRFDCRIPFLNGGLFDPINNYDWVDTDIFLPNDIFSNTERTAEGDVGTGVLDVFDRYNFTVKEDEPLEREVAVDPEMLGKVFENLLEVKDRKSTGIYYTPRTIVHYMCQESLATYLATQLGADVPRSDIETLIKFGETVVEHDTRVQNFGKETKTYSYKLPETVRANASKIDEALKAVRICDPAVGSGAFPVGMMSEIIRTRNALTPHLDASDRTIYDFKRHAIQNCLYGVDIDPGAVEIAKLRLWLSLVVDEDDIRQIKPLPNLDYKIVQGNSLVSVQHDLFNQQEFSQLEQLKPLYFNETNTKKKQEYKRQIDALIDHITSSNKDFDFTIYFSEVFHYRRGFDVVIANPPYIDSEGMVRGGQGELRDFISSTFKMTKGNWDIYIAFFERGFGILNDEGTLTFITPDKWMSKPFGTEWRTHTVGNLYKILRAGRHVFENAKVDSVVSFFKKGRSTTLDVYDVDGDAVAFKDSVDKRVLRPPYAFDFLLSEHLEWLLKLDELPNTLSGLGRCESACATSDAYKLKPLVKDLKRDLFDPTKHLKVVNTGTAGKYVSRWGHREMTYLKGKYAYPVVDRQEFLRLFRGSYAEKAVKPKLIMKGLTLLDACLDDAGHCVPGKSTLVVTAASVNDLKCVAAIVNSKLAFFYVREKYPASSYNEGITFTKEMINNLPVPVLSSQERGALVDLVDQILGIAGADDYFDDPAKQTSVQLLQKRIDQLIYRLYGVEASVIALMEQSHRPQRQQESSAVTLN